MFNRGGRFSTEPPPCALPRNTGGGKFGAAPPFDRGEIGVEEAEGVAGLDRAHAFLDLLSGDCLVELLHPGPVQLGAIVVLGVIAVIEPDDVVPLGV